MIQYAVLSETGDRSVNEDAVGAFEANQRYCFVVCDGLGGHGMGDVASACVKDVFGNCFEQTKTMEEFLPHAFTTAQNTLLQEQIKRKAQKKMKTTAAVLAMENETAYVGHIGDSRVYCFYRNKIKSRTLDHSIPQMLVISRQIKEKEIRHHPDRNIVLRVMGVQWDEPKYELEPPIALKKCQAFLLCSDGFWEWIEEKDMCCLLKHASSPEDWLEAMAKVIRANGQNKEMDNYSAIAVWV